MSAWLSFYEIRKPEGLPERTVDLDAYEDVLYAEPEKAEPWQKRIGVLRDVRQTSLDLFKAAEAEFGERPECMSMRAYRAAGAEYEYLFTTKDGTVKSVLDVDLEKYRERKRFKAFLYVMRGVSDAKRTESILSDDRFDRAELSLDDFEVLISRCLKAAEEGSPDAEQDLLAVMKARAVVLSGGTVVSLID